MKKFLILFLLNCFGVLLSLDNICLKDGEEISCKVIEIAPDFVKYKKASNLDGPLYNLRAHKILFIKYENGEKEIYNSARFLNETQNYTTSNHETKGETLSRKFTFILGGGIAKLENDDWESDLIPSGIIGFSYSKIINNNFAYDIGAGISRKGGEVKRSLYSAEFEFISLDLPLLIKAKINPASHLYSLFGLRASITLTSDYKYESYEYWSSYERNGELKLFSAGVVGAFGYETNRVNMEIRADYGLTDISDDDFLNEINDKTFWIILGYKF